MKHTNPNLKPLKCYSCPEILQVDRRTERCQCSACILTNKPYPRNNYSAPETDDSRQLVLGEVA